MHWREAALRESPFTFYARLLGRGGGRKSFLARLGPEANDALDEFLNLALDYEKRETPSLQGFVAWLRAASAEVKRDMEIARDEVRVMTVHGAKGLEAHTVILADTTTAAGRPVIRRGLIDAAACRAATAFVWATSKDTDPPIVATRERPHLRDQADEQPTLYVAMTRAEQRLVICGTSKPLKQDERLRSRKIVGEHVEEPTASPRIFARPPALRAIDPGEEEHPNSGRPGRPIIAMQIHLHWKQTHGALFVVGWEPSSSSH